MLLYEVNPRLPPTALHNLAEGDVESRQGRFCFISPGSLTKDDLARGGEQLGGTGGRLEVEQAVDACDQLLFIALCVQLQLVSIGIMFS